MGSDPNELFEFVSQSALEDAHEMARTYWPGALTLILPASGPFVDALNPGGSNLGMRVPACEMTLELLSQSGPLATTSANKAGKQPPLNAEETANYFPDLPLLAPVPWSRSSGLASTLALWQSPGCWHILRSGAVILKGIKKS